MARRRRATTIRPAVSRPQDPKPGCLESDNSSRRRRGTSGRSSATRRRPAYDFNLAGGGALVKDRLWVNGSVRRWIVNKLVNAKNDDGTQAIDDNTLKNYSGQGRVSRHRRTRS